MCSVFQPRREAHGKGKAAGPQQGGTDSPEGLDGEEAGWAEPGVPPGAGRAEREGDSTLSARQDVA